MAMLFLLIVLGKWGRRVSVVKGTSAVDVKSLKTKKERSRKRVGMRMPGVEPGMSPSQGEVLTTILHTPGEAGYRSQYLSHAKRALYHLSYIPFANHKPPRFRSHACCTPRPQQTVLPPPHCLHLLARAISMPTPPIRAFCDAFCDVKQCWQISSLSRYPPSINHRFQLPQHHISLTDTITFTI